MRSGGEDQAALEEARGLYRAGRHADGEALTARAVVDHPGSAELWNVRGVFLRQLGRPGAAREALERAIALKPDFAGARTNLANVTIDLAAEAERSGGGVAAAVALLDEALAKDPDAAPLLEAKAMLLRRTGDAAAALLFLEDAAARRPELAWPHALLGQALIEADPARAEAELRRAVAIAPDDRGALAALAGLLAGTIGRRPALSLAEAQALARRAAALGGLNLLQLEALRQVLTRTWDFVGLERLDGFEALGRGWAASGAHAALIAQLPWAAAHADRLELLAQHRACGERLMEPARATPLPSRARRPPRGRLRLGFLSADLRRHPVGYFVEPLFAHPDPAIETFCYALDPGLEDPLKAFFEDRADHFHRLPQAGARELAEVIAADGLDVLVELGGSTGLNKLEALAWRPSPVQVSWLGYPHSTGLPTIDGFVCDPWNRPTDPALLLEAPLELPRTWIALGRSFAADHPEPPGAARTGPVTFGTANAAYKYTPAVLGAWAEIVAAAPGSRFAFVRPECASGAFRDNVAAIFAEAGVAADHIDFHVAGGGRHMPFYAAIDVSLDTFPLTGGTTTVEALWMGVPVVTLRGEAFHERLSASILANVGLEDLIADDLADYRAKALGLAKDADRRRELRFGLRERLRLGPLGDAEAFARAFHGLMSRAGAQVRS